MASQPVLEKIKQSIAENRSIRKIKLGYVGTNKIIDTDIDIFMKKHYPSWNYTLSNDSGYNRWIYLESGECQCKDCTD